MNNIVSFNRTSHDPFIDFLKGICIIFVILTHTISLSIHEYTAFCLWGDMAVPIFLLIQVFNVYKHLPTNMSFQINLTKLAKRIIIPFIFAQIIGLIIAFIQNKGFCISELMKFGNLGAGAYYPYIHIQFSILLVLFAHLFKLLRKHISFLCLFFIIVSAVFELLANYTHIGQGLYRILFIRYFFLIYLGFLWTIRPIRMNATTLCISIFSILFILLFNYFDDIIKFEPWFYMKGWKIFHWVSYFYVANLLVWIINWIYSFSTTLIKNIVTAIGKFSYEIFLFPMLYFMISPLRLLNFKFYGGVEQFIIPLADVAICSAPILYIKRKKLSV